VGSVEAPRSGTATLTPPGIDAAAVGRVAGVVRTQARRLRQEETWADPRFWNSDEDRAARCQFLAVGNAVNFRFWTRRHGVVVPEGGVVDGEFFRGSMYLWRRLRVACQRGQFDLSAEALAAVTAESLTRAFADDNGRNPLGVGIEDRVLNLRDLGARLRDHWGGSFERVVDAAGGSLAAFAELSRRFRAYDDPIEKLTMLNAIMLQGSGLTTFDTPPLPAIDYHLVKQAVRQGLVHPDEATSQKLKQAGLLTRREAQGLRRSVLTALTMVAEEAGVSTAALDNLYWLNRQVCTETEPACTNCSFAPACARLTELGLPLEYTRYY
jgi:hypothetical protein